jgi:S1-C subfamily serine protease
VVSNQGQILTNNHVVAGCRTLATRDGKQLRVLSRSASSDLALLQADFAPSAVAVFRTGAAPKLGDEVVAFGFPLPGLLSSNGNVSAGIVSATSGLQNDIRFIQISAPVQPGNSGGPLFDSSGHVIGVVVSKLDAVKVAQITGDVPQNVNFAVHWAEVRAFLDDAGVRYPKEISQHARTTRSIAATATEVAVAIECTP